MELFWIFWFGVLFFCIFCFVFMKNRPYNKAIDAFVALIESGEIETAYTLSMKGEDKAETAGIFTVAGRFDAENNRTWVVSNSPYSGGSAAGAVVPDYIDGKDFIFEGKRYNLYFLICRALRRAKNRKGLIIRSQKSRAPGGVDGFINKAA